jgi:hypothetical protein
LNLRATKHVNKQACRGIRPVYSFCGRLPVECAVFQFPVSAFSAHGALDLAKADQIPIAFHSASNSHFTTDGPSTSNTFDV